jgi:small subunit ribosomal protein S19e
MAVYDTPAAKYNEKLAAALKEMPEFEMPKWAEFVKTSVARERPPKEEFWHKRAASILRQLYIHGIVGVNRLRTRYGGRKNRGVRPERFRKGSGKIIRVILQQAEAAGFVEKIKGKKTGRWLTEKGKEFLDSIGDKEEKQGGENAN